MTAAVTARDGGVSGAPYATLNLSLSVGDEPSRVLENRRRLAGKVFILIAVPCIGFFVGGYYLMKALL